jgi:hypothetical protein
LESYPFLAITSPVPSDNLVVEGWMHEYAMREAAAEYAIIGTFLRTGGPTMGKGAAILTTTIPLPV